MRSARKLAAACVITLLFVGCGGDDTGDDGEAQPAVEAVDVVAQDFAFEPTSIPAGAGDVLTVAVSNEDDVEHSFTIEDADVDVVVAAGASEEVEVAVEQVPLEFVCRFHPAMTGTIGGGQADAGSGGMGDDLDY